jgi:hypothetical protein
MGGFENIVLYLIYKIGYKIVRVGLRVIVLYLV